jgi:hypothetical protein
MVKQQMIQVAKTSNVKIYFIINPKDISSDGVVIRGKETEYVQFWPYVTQLGSELVPLTNNEFLKSLWMSNVKRKSKNWAKSSEDWTRKFLNREVAFTKEELKSIETSLIPTPSGETPSGVKRQVRRRVLSKKILLEQIELKAVNKPNLPNAPKKPTIGGGAPGGRALKPAVFDPRSADADGDGWRQEGTTARWYGVGLNSPIVESLRSEMRLIQGNAYHDLTGMANLNYSYFADAPPPLGSTLEADLAWLGGQLSLASVVNPGMTEGRWLVGREQVRKQTQIREGVLPTPDISELSDSDILKNLEQIIDTRKKARVAKDAKTRVAAPDNVSDEALAAARDFDVDTADPRNIDADVKAMFNFEFIGMDGEKYSAEIQRSYLQNVKYEDGSSPRRLAINGKIFKDGKEVGFFDRTIYPDTKTVVHDHMHLDDEVRGAQISGIINARNELIYRSLGCDVITTKAASNIGYNGATHWPKVGFDWQDDYNREVYFAAVDSALTKFALAINEDPDILPMMQKLDPKSGMFAFLPIFSSREEAEEVALLLTLARTQSMDDPDRLTAGDLVNWSGAESWFQVNAIEGGLARSIGGQEEIADVLEAENADAPKPDVSKPELVKPDEDVNLRPPPRFDFDANPSPPPPRRFNFDADADRPPPRFNPDANANQTGADADGQVPKLEDLNSEDREWVQQQLEAVYMSEAERERAASGIVKEDSIENLEKRIRFLELEEIPRLRRDANNKNFSKRDRAFAAQGLAIEEQRLAVYKVGVERKRELVPAKAAQVELTPEKMDQLEKDIAERYKNLRKKRGGIVGAWMTKTYGNDDPPPWETSKNIKIEQLRVMVARNNDEDKVRIREWVKQVYAIDEVVGRNGMRFRVQIEDSDIQIRDSQIDFAGKVRAFNVDTNEWEDVGGVVRIINVKGGYVTNAQLMLGKSAGYDNPLGNKAKNEGFTSVFNPHAFTWLKASGFERAEVTAISDGRFVWGRAGFRQERGSVMGDRIADQLMEEVKKYRNGEEDGLIRTDLDADLIEYLTTVAKQKDFTIDAPQNPEYILALAGDKNFTEAEKKAYDRQLQEWFTVNAPFGTGKLVFTDENVPDDPRKLV